MKKILPLLLLLVVTLFTACGENRVVNITEPMPNQLKVFGCYKVVSKSKGELYTEYAVYNGTKVTYYKNMSNDDNLEVISVESVNPQIENIEGKSFEEIEEKTITADDLYSLYGCLLKMIAGEQIRCSTKAEPELPDNFSTLLANHPPYSIQSQKMPNIRGIMLYSVEGFDWTEHYQGQKYALASNCSTDEALFNCEILVEHPEIEATKRFTGNTKDNTFLTDQFSTDGILVTLKTAASILEENGYVTKEDTKEK